ncbi:MAG TPA: ABC transporter ATP-binding protein [Candidatus Dorea stercoravium]|uniref:ABC transporter ATP-binding protein n=1 Tax=Lachnoclostridium phocaeense TaxID=1871021 RepID=UPI00051BF9F0|nr:MULTISPECIES: ABC transporter ATP-binding protein [Clostridia]HJA42463.1 ABC transporter ATP-binding protein [Candidatus Dorea stercoravium]
MVSIHNLVKRYGDVLALDHLDLEIKRGEIYGLLGPNGSGKTTAINCLLALLGYDKGSIRVFGEKMEPDSYESKRRIGVVMQNVAVFEELTVRENIDYFCSLYVKDKKRRRQLVEEAVRFTGLEDHLKKYPKKLSGGLLRRLNIACGIAHRPELILMDEPTVAVDPQSRNHILEGIKKLNEQGSTIIYTSHYMEEVEKICTRISIMDRGRILATGTKEELKAMIGTGETITVETGGMTGEQVEEVRLLPGVVSADCQEGVLRVQCTQGAGNLTGLLHRLEEADIPFGRVWSQPPTLNDVFLEITGKRLRDRKEEEEG